MGRDKGMRKGTQTSHGNFRNFTTTSLKAFTHGVRCINPGTVADGSRQLRGECNPWSRGRAGVSGAALGLFVGWSS